MPPVIKYPLGARRPRGRAVFWTSNEITGMSRPSEEQQRSTALRVEEDSKELAQLLRATVAGALIYTTLGQSRFRWDATVARFRDTSTDFLVRRREVATLFQSSIYQSELRAARLSDQLLARELLVSEWQAALRNEMQHVHALAHVTARGGWAQVSPESWGRLQAITREQYAFLNGFARQVETGATVFNGQIRARSRRYIRAARSTYYNSQHEMLVDRQGKFPGVILARRVYGGTSRSERCDGCEREHDRGWQMAEVVAYIGSQECGPNCNCYLIYKTVRDLTNAQILIGSLTDDDE